MVISFFFIFIKFDLILKKTAFLNNRIGADDLGSSSDDSSDNYDSQNSKSSEKSTDKVSPSKIIKSDDDGARRSSKESSVEK